MTTTTDRPVPRWVRITAVVTVLIATVLLALGGFVTTFRVGMADPVWPTEPWFLVDKDWTQLEFGFLIEHVHRLAGWLTGFGMTAFAIGAWIAEPSRRLRILGLVFCGGLLFGYGQFHRAMGQVWTQVKEEARTASNLDPKQPDFEQRLVELDIASHVKAWPLPQATATGLFAVGLLVFGGLAVTSGANGGWVRFIASIGLVCVMAQGLLGGFRVFLNALAGTNLAAIHGVFGQITFAVLVAGMVLCSPARVADVSNRSGLLKHVWAIVGVLIAQLVWAVWVRHMGSAVAQRLHILTAFVATGLLVGLAMRLMPVPSFRGIGIHLLIILGVQLLLGVEAYLGKFAAVGPQAQKLPFERTVTPSQAWLRTGHQLIGAGLLAAVAAAAVRVGRSRGPTGGTKFTETFSTEDLRDRLPEHATAS